MRPVGKIVPLSKETLQSAMKLVDICFPVKMEHENTDLLQASLGMKDISLVDKNGVYIKYWVVLKGKDVIGLVGLFGERRKVKKEYWLDYFCVHPSMRGKGIGTKLLNFAILKARKEDKKYLKLYTAEGLDEAAAQHLYEEKGFEVTKKRRDKNFPYMLIYYRLFL